METPTTQTDLQPAPDAHLPEEQHKHELLARVGEELRLAYHGVLRNISERRMSMGGDRMETMDHKDALYADIGNIAAGQEAVLTDTVSGQTARPRSFVERYMDKRLDKKNWRAELQASERKRTVAAYGGERSQTMRSDSLIDTFARKRVAGSVYRAGDMSAAELRLARADIQATPRAFENSEQRKTRRRADGAVNDLEKTAEQPVLSRWRGWRRGEAIKDIKRHHSRAEKHRVQEDKFAARRAEWQAGAPQRVQAAQAEKQRKQERRRERMQRVGNFALSVGRGISDRLSQHKDETVNAYHEGLSNEDVAGGRVQQRIDKLARLSGRRYSRTKTKLAARRNPEA